MISRASLVLLLSVLAAACGPSTPPGAPLGAACESGGECQEGLFCLVAAPMQGTCEAIPAACGPDPSCSSGCFDEFDGACAMGHACVSFNGEVSFVCN
jgi:hypothetical protein